MSQLLVIYVFLIFGVLFAGLTVFSASAFATTLLSSIFSLTCALLYFFLNSPDVAMTEASVGVFFSTAIYLMTIRTIRIESVQRASVLKIIVTAIMFLLMGWVLHSVLFTNFTFGMGEFVGSAKAQLTASYTKYQIPNSVTTILASFRSFDTMGETMIIFTAGLGVFLILNTRHSKFVNLH